MITLETRQCPRCGNDYETEVARFAGSVSTGIPLDRRCPACRPIADAESEAIWRKIRRPTRAEQEWERVCPRRYRESDPLHQDIDPQIAEMAQRWDPRSKRGLGFIGPTELGKTRMLFFALHRALRAGLSIEAVSHNRLSVIAQDAFAGSKEEKLDARREITQFERCGVLLLDDLGKPPSTPRADSVLGELIETRTAEDRPILWSSNMGGQSLIDQFGPDRGEPIVRRLTECCETLNSYG